ncbi:hypothetical protein CYMTET_11870 [Cymbomonas tetramitiformis]|uniref:Uncharacterized protein n=1 Tax=Cymbomonas tetramitiformis TaxID=36881 RepID=A0AAE0GLV0_9CHLO|nr:hypothetical protein CYMTET_11870 [Cymbomonas tetramitiformis]
MPKGAKPRCNVCDDAHWIRDKKPSRQCILIPTAEARENIASTEGCAGLQPWVNKRGERIAFASANRRNSSRFADVPLFVLLQPPAEGHEDSVEFMACLPAYETKSTWKPKDVWRRGTSGVDASEISCVELDQVPTADSIHAGVPAHTRFAQTIQAEFVGIRADLVEISEINASLVVENNELLSQNEKLGATLRRKAQELQHVKCKFFSTFQRLEVKWGGRDKGHNFLDGITRVAETLQRTRKQRDQAKGQHAANQAGMKAVDRLRAKYSDNFEKEVSSRMRKLESDNAVVTALQDRVRLLVKSESQLKGVVDGLKNAISLLQR